MVLHKLQEKEIPFTSQTNEELEKKYSGNQTILYKASDLKVLRQKQIFKLVMALMKIS